MLLEARQLISFPAQALIIFRRAAKQFSPSQFLMSTTFCVFLGFFLGITTGSDYRYPMRCLQFVQTAVLLGIIGAALALDVFLYERIVYRREMTQYSPLAYRA